MASYRHAGSSQKASDDIAEKQGIRWFRTLPTSTLSGRQSGISASLVRMDFSGVTEATDVAPSDAYVICIHLGGTMSLSVKTEDRRYLTTCLPGGFCVGRPGETASLRYEDAALEFVHIVLPKQWIEDDETGFSGAKNAGSVELRDPMGSVSPRLLAMTPKIRAMFQGRGPTSVIRMEAMTLEIGAHLVEKYSNWSTSSVPSGGLSGGVLRRTLEYFNDHLGEDVSLSDMARQANLSTAHFCRAFSETVGVTPYRYLLNVRLQKAAELLSKTAVAVGDIGALVGFMDAAHFSRSFSREFGVSPSRWRSNATV